MLLLLTLESLGISLSERLRVGRLLDLGEIEAVVRACSLHLDELQESVLEVVPIALQKVTRIESVRTAARPPKLHEVLPGTAAIRLHYIRRYISWLCTAALLKQDPSSESFNRLTAAQELVDRALKARTPDEKNRNMLNRREGLSEDELAKLLKVIAVDSPDNPWKGEHNRIRNNLIVRWYLLTGMRRGELLNVQIPDINFQSNEVLIVRRADESADPRVSQPLVKTADRLLPVHPELAKDTHAYVLQHRRKVGNAKRHPYLFVASISGAPLSLAAVNLVFQQLRTVDGLPSNLSPHVLRHTWNDQFSALADREGFSEEVEKKMRSRLMGWSETSESASVYTRRHIRKKSREAMLSLQGNLAPGAKNEG